MQGSAEHHYTGNNTHSLNQLNACDLLKKGHCAFASTQRNSTRQSCRELPITYDQLHWPNCSPSWMSRPHLSPAPYTLWPILLGTNERNVDHEQNVDTFLQRCEKAGLRLNPGKVQLRKKEVPFIDHVSTRQGLGADPAKVQAFIGRCPDGLMLQLYNVYWVSHNTSLSSYHTYIQLHKAPAKAHPKDTKWIWDDVQERALDVLKKLSQLHQFSATTTWWSRSHCCVTHRSLDSVQH